jgi:iron complex outermembrane receptor protein
MRANRNSSMTNTTHIRRAALALCLTVPAIAAAQTIDYGSLEQLFNEPVTTSATGSPQRATEAPVAMEIISAEDIRRSGATDIPTILSRVAGVDVLTWGANGAADVSIRGYDQGYSPRLLVLINGRQVYLDHYGYTAWATLPVQLSEIRQIEVVKGPNSALFGFNAVGGVVNIITYNPKYDDVSNVTLRGGTNGTSEGMVVDSFKLGQSFAARVSAGGSQSDQFANETSTGPTDAARLVNPHRIATNVDTLTQLSPSVQLRVEGSYSQVLQSDVDPYYDYFESEYLTESLKATLTAETTLGLAEVTAYRNHLDVNYGSTIGPLEWTNTITVLNAQDLFKLGTASTVRVAFEFRRNQLPTAPIEGAEVDYNVYAPSAMWNWALSDRLSFTAALRYDSMHVTRSGDFPGPTPFIPAYGLTLAWPTPENSLFDRTINATSANAGFVWRPTAADTLRLSYARGVQAPTILELGGIQAAVQEPQIPVAFMGNPAIQPAIITNYELGYDHSLDAIGGRTGVKLFSQTTDGLVGDASASNILVPPSFAVLPGLGAVPTSLPGVGWANVGNSRMTGAEFYVNGKLGTALHWGLNYTYTDITETAYPGINLLAVNVAFDQTSPKSRANLNVGWDGDKWSADGFVRYVSAFRMFLDTALQPVPAYETLAGRVGYAISKNASIALSGENLLHTRQVETSGLLVERRVLISLQQKW